MRSAWCYSGTWRVALLPYLGYGSLHSQFRLDEPWDSDHNKKLLAYIPPVFVSPDRFDVKTNLLVPTGANMVFPPDKAIVPRHIEDGAARTVQSGRDGSALFGFGFLVVAFLTTAAPDWNNWANDPSFVVMLLQLQSFLASSPRELPSAHLREFRTGLPKARSGLRAFQVRSIP